ncbi:sodium:solute symporter family protein [Roseivirga thermotolerans]|uniref:Sodium/glucose cotransporter n=1 Tax=Roseivirga thermotolerans TaxID=1758176 RepID=A0ABQ3I4F5_9BACT|nr:sodium:solute symporter family protein [Roseivirga thermotolerans]GHE53044.1 sodium/glucose cotransporter [Roseivirga thermotolerans]
MNISTIDWIIIVLFFLVFLAIGLKVSRKAGSSSKEFFLSGRNMPWWLLGVSMVATTFSADTPNLVTDIVRQNGVAGNWTWWAFLITGMLTVFIYAKLWRKSGVLTDLEFYEKRYSGKEAAFLRGFRAIYLGVFFNVMIMASVSLAAIKIGEVMFGLEPWKTVVYASVITVAYSSLGGLRGVILTDFLQFLVAMVGSVAAAIYIVNLPEVGGLTALLEKPEVASKLNLIPSFSNRELFITLLVIPLAVQWWSVWYPGAEPGGGGYIAQRMLSSKNEKHAVSATFLFNITHYALRPWPWILIALASLVVYPDLASIREAFPSISEGKIGHDLGYSAMLLTLPKGLLGIVIASLIAAYMSTISTHLNWGSSYVAFDFYQRFVKPDATEKELVNVGRISTVVLMVLAGLFALVLTSAYDAFQILLSIGAGTGSIFILRWFWWRINAYSEIAGMVVSFILALLFKFGPESLTSIPSEYQLLLSVGITTLAWVSVTLLTKPTDYQTLLQFFNLVKPYGIGWNGLKKQAFDRGEKPAEGTGKFSVDLLAIFLGIIIVYAALFSVGMFIYGETLNAVVLLIIALAATLLLRNAWKKLSF